MAKKQTPVYAGMTKQQLHAAIADAGDAATLEQIDSGIAAVGYSAEGITRKLIANRAAVLAGEEPPHVIPDGKSLPPLTARGG